MSLIIIRKDAVSKLPAGPKKYIEEYFEEKNLFGIEVVVCQMMLSAPGGGFRKGHGPSHSVDTHRYHKGLPEDWNLSRWFIDQARKKGSSVFDFFICEPHRNEDHSD